MMNEVKKMSDMMKQYVAGTWWDEDIPIQYI